MKNNKGVLSIITVTLLGCLAMTVTDAYIRPPYAVKSLVKAVLFLILPILAIPRKDGEARKKLLLPDRKGIVVSISLGAAVYALILGAFLFFRRYYDFSGIPALLEANVGVKKDNFLLVSLYIAVCNSFLEEYFFRRFAFLELRERWGRLTAYLFSSLSFAAYHIAMMNGWFSPAVFILAIIGLAVGGAMFDLLDEKGGSIMNSWMVHMFANLAINTVGCILLGII